MSLEKEELKAIAEMVQIEMTKEEEEIIQKDLKCIFKLMDDQLQKIDIHKELKPMVSPCTHPNRLRQDKVQYFEEKEELLGALPMKNGYFYVPNVL
ncbi:MAG: Asp-tRNA(Asn)/Glu-tRNA(Gln) amidotransferase subunit GatC [Epulopiscium sp.]|nr:Asp-tRNA(Asn)/Glu-tRNA(Gln) amidotransferase subunit GatC [Candidatus Epulonipiscium sp.]